MITPRDLLTEAILTTADYLRAWGVTLPDDLETDLETLKAVRLRRDRREPGQAEKATAEERVAAIFRRIFKRQRARVLAGLEGQYPERKGLKYADEQARDESGRWTSAGESDLGSFSTDELRQAVQEATHTVDNVISGEYSVGVEGGGGKDMVRAAAAGLFTTKIGKVPIYAISESAAQPLVNYLRGGGKYGSVSFSRLLGYQENELALYRELLKRTNQQDLLN